MHTSLQESRPAALHRVVQVVLLEVTVQQWFSGYDSMLLKSSGLVELVKSIQS